MRTGNHTVSKPALLVHGAAFLFVGFVAGLGARSAVDVYQSRPPAPSSEPRDEFVVAPGTADSPPMLMWVAAELDDAADTRPGARTAQTLSYALPPREREAR